MNTTNTTTQTAPVAGSADWRAIADDLAAALERLDGLYRSEQDADAPMSRPEWLSGPWQRYSHAMMISDRIGALLDTNHSDGAPTR